MHIQNTELVGEKHKWTQHGGTGGSGGTVSSVFSRARDYTTIWLEGLQ